MRSLRPQNVGAILVLLLGVLIGIIVLSTRTPHKVHIAVVGVSLVANGNFDTLLEYRMRIVAVSLCKQVQTITQPVAPYYKTTTGRECVPILDTRAFAYDGGCASGRTEDNMNGETFSNMFINFVPVDTYTHVVLQHEQIVSITGSVLKIDNTTRLYTHPCGEYECTNTTCVDVRLEQSPGTTAGVDLGRFGREIVIPFKTPPVLDYFSSLNLINIRYSLYNVASATNPTVDTKFALLSGDNAIKIQKPTFIAYTGEITTTTYNTIIADQPAGMATCDNYTPITASSFSGGTAIFQISRNVDGTVVGAQMAIASLQHVYPIETYSLQQTATLLNVTQIMDDGTACPRLVNVNHVNPTLCQADCLILIGTYYYSLTTVVLHV